MTQVSMQKSAPYLQHKLIRASAGSGKTYRLSSQFIMLVHRGAPPRSILATTFTRKAAGEILGRVLRRLASAALHPASAAELAKSIHASAFSQEEAHRLLKLICDELHRVNVSTLDSFFSRMASSFRLELDLPVEPVMVSPTAPQAVRARQEAIEALLANAQPDVMVDLLRRTHHDHVSRSVTKAIDDIITSLYEQYRLTPEEEVWSRLPVHPVLEDEHLELVVSELAEFLEQDLGKKMNTAIQNNLEAFNQRDWKRFFDTGIAKALLNGNAVFDRKPIPEDLQQAYHPLIVHAKASMLNKVAVQTHATWELLREFETYYENIRRSRNLVMFSDLPLKLCRGMDSTSDPGAPGLDAIYYRLDGRVSHMLLDEFQDTSPQQWQVLRPLASEIVEHEGQDRCFFCVGDVKQSIYNWRGGCAELFDKLTDDLLLPAEAVESLNSSYRTSQDVLDVVNRVFKNLPDSLPVLNKVDDPVVPVTCRGWSQVFSHHKAERSKPGYVKLLTSPGDDPDDDELLEVTDDEDLPETALNSHVQFAAEYVVTLAQMHPGRSIGVLVKTNKMVNHLIHLMQKQGLAASGEGGNPVTDDPAVELILSALLLADHPGDTVARHHVATSPLVNARELSLTDLSPAGLEQFSMQVRQKLMQSGYPSLIESWAQALAPHGDERNATRLSQLIELAESYQPQATPRPRHFVDYVKATPVEEPMPAPVRVMTVHKAKGLEFDIVVLPELHKTMGVNQRQMADVYREEPTGPVVAIYRSSNKEIRAMSLQLQEAHEQGTASRLRDDLCAFYVALTRPRQALHMIVPSLQYTATKKVSGKGVTNLSPAAILRSTLGVTDEIPAQAQVLYEHGNALWDHGPDARSIEPQPVVELAAPVKVKLHNADAPSRSWRIVAPSNLEAGAQVKVHDILKLTSEQGRFFGSLIHAMFQQIQWLDQPSEVLPLKEIIRQAGDLLPAVEEAELNQVGETFGRMIRMEGIIAALSQPALQDPAGRVELWRERPFAVKLDGMLLRGIMDRVVIQRDAHGRPLSAELLDFKTDRVGDEGISPILHMYHPQIRAYQKALAIMLDLPLDRIEASLLLTGPGMKVKVNEKL